MERLRELLRVDGRLSQIGFWRAYLFLTIVGAVSWCLGLFAILVVGPIGVVLLLPIFPVLAANITILIRRLHDRGKSGWWTMPFFVLPFLASFGLSVEVAGASPRPLVALTSLGLSLLVLLGWIEIGFRRGVAGPNRYGEALQVAV